MDADEKDRPEHETFLKTRRQTLTEMLPEKLPSPAQTSQTSLPNVKRYRKGKSLDLRYTKSPGDSGLPYTPKLTRRQSLTADLHNTLLAESFANEARFTIPFPGHRAPDPIMLPQSKDSIAEESPSLSKRRKSALPPSSKSTRDLFFKKNQKKKIRRLSAKPKLKGASNDSVVGYAHSAETKETESTQHVSDDVGSRTISENMHVLKEFEMHLQYLTALAVDKPDDEDQTPRLCSTHLTEISRKFSSGKNAYKDQLLAQTKITCQDRIRTLLYKEKECCKLKLCCFSKYASDEHPQHSRVLSYIPFDIFILCLIFVNTCIIVLEQVLRHHHENAGLRNGTSSSVFQGAATNLDHTLYMLGIVDLVFLLVFTIECLLRLYALHLKRFANSAWNIFDVFIVVLGWITVFLQRDNGNGTSGTTALRMLRMARVIRSFRLLKDILIILDIVKREARLLFTVLSMAFFVMLIFTSAGMQLFGPSLQRRCVLTKEDVISSEMAQKDLWKHSNVSMVGIFDNPPRWCSNSCDAATDYFENSSWIPCLGPPVMTTIFGHGHTCTAYDSSMGNLTGENGTRYRATCALADKRVLKGFSNRHVSISGGLDFLSFQNFHSALLSVWYIISGDAVYILLGRLAGATSLLVSALFTMACSYLVGIPLFLSMQGLICTGLSMSKDDFFRNNHKLDLMHHYGRGGLDDSCAEESTSSSLQAGTKKQEPVLMKHNFQGKSLKESVVEKTFQKRGGKKEGSARNPSSDGISPHLPPSTTISTTNTTNTTQTRTELSEGKVDFSNINVHPYKSSRRSTLNDWQSRHLQSKCIRAIVESIWFDALVLLLIVLNTVILLVEMDPSLHASSESRNFFVYVEFCFSALFCIEIFLRMLAWGTCGYFGKARFNIFDFIVVISTSAISVLQMVVISDLRSERLYLDAGQAASAGRMLRLFKISRASRITKATQMIGSLKQLSTLAVDSFYSVSQAMMLACIVGSIFAIALSTQGSDDGKFCTVDNSGVGSYMSFENFSKSLYTLLMTIGWDHVWFTFDGCLNDEKYAHVIIYILWLLSVPTLVNKIITAVIVANFEASDSERKLYVTQRHYYLHLIHKEENRFLKACRLLELTSGYHAGKIHQNHNDETVRRINALSVNHRLNIARITARLTSLKVAVLSPENGFPSRELRSLRDIVIENIEKIHVEKLALAIRFYLLRSDELKSKFEKVEKQIRVLIRWHRMRPEMQLPFTLHLMHLISLFMIAEATSPANSLSENIPIMNNIGTYSLSSVEHIQL